MMSAALRVAETMLGSSLAATITSIPGRCLRTSEIRLLMSLTLLAQIGQFTEYAITSAGCVCRPPVCIKRIPLRLDLGAAADLTSAKGGCGQPSQFAAIVIIDTQAATDRKMNVRRSSFEALFIGIPQEIPTLNIKYQSLRRYNRRDILTYTATRSEITRAIPESVTLPPNTLARPKPNNRRVNRRSLWQNK